jgi:hypothetical protein
MKKIKRILLTTTIFSMFLCTASIALPSMPVHAAAKCAGVDISIDVGCSDSDTNPILAYTKAIIRFLSGLIAVAVIGAIIFFGIMYMTANGDAGQTKKAVAGIRESVIGLLLFIFMFAIVQFLVPGGLFESKANTTTPSPSASPSGYIHAGNLTTA